MMWDKEDCPLCGQIMKVVHGDKSENLYLIRCPTYMEIPEKHQVMLKGKYTQDSYASHFEVEYQNFKPVYSSLRLYPYCIKSYTDVSNIYMYDFQLYNRFIVETPFIEFNYKDTQSIIQKLATYTLFS